MSKDRLEDLRVKIDAVDQALHDLVIKRAALSHQIGDLKKEANLPVVNAAREAQVMRHLIAQHSGDLPVQTVVAIWRELIGASCQIQNVMRVVCAGPDMILARHYFGAAAPIDPVSSALLAISFSMICGTRS